MRWLSALFSVSLVCASSPPEIELPLGKIRGRRHPFKPVDGFLGIPYGLSTSGERRFAPPVAFSTPWTPATRDASEFGPKCPQEDKHEDIGSEDCLTVNVWKPASLTPEASLPVFVFIHGGAWMWGDSAGFPLDGFVESQGVVAVSMNYRVGTLGFLSSLATLAQYGTTGNWGLLDQRLALHWVQRHIGLFGGDPSRVTLMGESAGAFSVQWHMVSKPYVGTKEYGGALDVKDAESGRPLFTQAIIQSGGASNGWFYQKLEDSLKFSKYLATVHGGCGSNEDLSCLREVHSSALLVRLSDRMGSHRPDYASPLFAISPFGVAIDGEVLTGEPLALLESQGPPSWLKRVIIGTNAQEGTYFTTQLKKTVKYKSYQAQNDKCVPHYLTVGDEVNAKNVAFIFGYFFGDKTEKTFASIAGKSVYATQAFTTGPCSHLNLHIPADVLNKYKVYEKVYSKFVDDRVDEQSEEMEVFFTSRASEPPDFNGDKKQHVASFHMVSDALRDFLFQCPSMSIADVLQRSGKVDVRMFVFSMPVMPEYLKFAPLKTMSDETAQGQDLGAFHSAELPLSLGVLEDEDHPIMHDRKRGIIGHLTLSGISTKEPYIFMHTPALEDKHKRMSKVMTCLYGKYARGEALKDCEFMEAGAEWPEYRAEDPQYLHFNNFEDGLFAKTGEKIEDGPAATEEEPLNAWRGFQRSTITKRNICKFYQDHVEFNFRDYTQEGTYTKPPAAVPLTPTTVNLGLHDWEDL